MSTVDSTKYKMLLVFPHHHKAHLCLYWFAPCATRNDHDKKIECQIKQVNDDACSHGHHKNVRLSLNLKKRQEIEKTALVGFSIKKICPSIENTL